LRVEGQELRVEHSIFGFWVVKERNIVDLGLADSANVLEGCLEPCRRGTAVVIVASSPGVPGAELLGKPAGRGSHARRR